MHRKKKNFDSLICLLFIEGARISKTFTLKLTIQTQLQLYNKNMSSYRTKTKALLMVSIRDELY
jgi:hypothetical protein